jgi:shikimate kinase
MNDGRHLVLVGLMGVGKTAVGEECAKRLSRPLVDTDELVVAAVGRPISEIFASEGERAFRSYEQQAVSDACASPEPLVIACGGGAVLDATNRRRLRAGGCVMWLEASPALLASRVEEQGTERPLLAEGPDKVAALERLAVARAAAYEAAAHVRIPTEQRSIAEVADAVLEELARCAA